ncbi:unnamed protein product [Cunninghamella echinulata]
MNQIEKNQQQQHYFDQNKLLHQENTLKLSIHDLEDKNMELEQILESAQNQSSQLQTLHSKKTRALQNDIKLLTNHLNLATQHIDELEQQQQQNHYLNRTDSVDQNNNNNNLYQHETLLKELQQHITNLENENNQLIFTKKTVQEKLNHALSQLYQLKQQYQHYEGSQHDFQQLQLAYQQQFDQIHDLHLSLEEHRHLLSITLNNEPDLFHSHYHHPIDLIHDNLTTTDSFDSSQHYHGLKQNNNPLYNQLCTKTTTITPGKDLMSELENAWRRDRLIDISSDQQQQHPIENNNNNNKHINQEQHENWQMNNKNNNTTSSPSVIIDPFSNTEYHFTDLSCFYYSSEDHHDYENEAELFTTYNHTNHGYKLLHHEEEDDNHSLFGPIHSNHIPSYNLYPNLTATTMAIKKEEQNKLVVTQNSPVKLIHKVQRWCRFAIVLSMAIAINVIQGPNSMLEKEENGDDEKEDK